MSEAVRIDDPPDQWVKDTVAEPMVDVARQRGQVPDSHAIDREAQRMIERYDAEERERPNCHTSRPVAPRARDVAADDAKEIGARFVRDESLHLPAPEVLRLNPWQAALTGRMRKIISLVPGAKRGWRQKLFRYPRLAEEYLTELMAYKRRTGRYSGVNDRDAERMISRFSEDHADRSVSQLGAWRVGGV